MISIKYPLAGCAAAAALGALAAAGVAHAQSMSGQSMGGQSTRGASMGSQSGGSSQANQLQHLHDALHLNPHQEQAWRGYQAGTQPSPDEMQQMRAMSQMSLGGMSTPQRLDLINQGMTLRMEAFHHTADATRAFYATLNPSQQHTFDQITAPPSRGSQSQH